MNGRRHGADTEFSDEDRDRALRLSMVDGVLYALMIGIGEAYFIPNAIRIGATPLQLGLVISLPLLIGATFPLLMARRLAACPRRRPIVVAGVLVQVAVWLGVVAAGNFFGFLTPTVMILGLCVYQIGGQCAGVAWSSWYGDLVPAATRGWWFARRTRLLHFATFVGIITGGGLLQGLEGDPMESGVARVGFATIACIAGACRLVSARVLWMSPEPKSVGASRAQENHRLLGGRRGRNLSFLLGGSAVFYVTVYISSPFFTPYMLQVVQLDYLEFMFAIGVQAGIKVLSMPYWGRLVDRGGGRRVYAGAIMLASLVPLPWLFVDGFYGVIGAQLFSGLAWSAHEIAVFSLVLESTRRRSRPVIYASLGMCNATGQVGGSVLGGAILDATSYWTIFLISLIGRFAVAVVLPMQIRDVRRDPWRVRGPIVLRIIGYRPGAGPTHRPVLDHRTSDAAR